MDRGRRSSTGRSLHPEQFPRSRLWSPSPRIRGAGRPSSSPRSRSRVRAASSRSLTRPRCLACCSSRPSCVTNGRSPCRSSAHARCDGRKSVGGGLVALRGGQSVSAHRRPAGRLDVAALVPGSPEAFLGSALAGGGVELSGELLGAAGGQHGGRARERVAHRLNRCGSHARPLSDPATGTFSTSPLGLIRHAKHLSARPSPGMWRCIHAGAHLHEAKDNGMGRAYTRNSRGSQRRRRASRRIASQWRPHG